MDVSKTIPNVDNTTIEIDSDEYLRIKNSGVTTTKIADANITLAKGAAPNYVESSSCGTFSTVNTSATSVTNLSFSFTKQKANSVVLLFLAATTGGATGAAISHVGSGGAYIEFCEGLTVLGRAQIDSSGGIIGSLMNYDTSAAGSKTYNIKLFCNSSGTAFCINHKLVAYELF